MLSRISIDSLLKLAILSALCLINIWGLKLVVDIVIKILRN